ncbi:hypothetical protein XENOCAPTIV_018856, partial [Xenoophorus captivus]
LNNYFCPQIISIQLSLVIISFFYSSILVFILLVGDQRWRKQHIGSFGTSSHIDIFTYNVVLLDLLGTTGIFLLFFGSITHDPEVWNAGSSMFGISSTGHTLFHVLTCIERYLAVVHPIFYLRLRGSSGVRMRNITVGCIWLISIVVMTITIGCNVPYATTSLVLLSFTSVAFVFCSLSVLCALSHPGPGKGGGNREGTDRSKQRAFHTMIIITGTLSLTFINSLITSLVQILSVPFGYIFCLAGWSSVFFLLPSSLVLPLLFLQRKGKLQVCGHK